MSEYIDYLKEKKYHLMPKDEQDKIKKDFIKKKFSSDLSSMSGVEQDKALKQINDKLIQRNTEYLAANIGPQLPVDKQPGMGQEQKVLYQKKIFEDIQQEQKSSGNLNSFTDFASKTYNAISEDIKRNPVAVMNIANLLNPARVGDSIAYLGTKAEDSRRKQAKEYMQATGEKDLSGSQFPDVLVGEGIRQSGVGRLAESFSYKYDMKPGLGGEKKVDFGPEFTPRDRSGRILYGLGAILPDLPIFITGPIKGFAASKMISAYADARQRGIKEGHKVEFKDVKNVMIEGLKGAALGKALGVTGKLTGFATGKIKTGLANALMARGMQGASKIAEKMVGTIGALTEIGALATVLTAAEGGMNKFFPTTDAQKQHGFDMSIEKIIDGAFTIGIMKAGNILGAKIVDPVTKEATTKMQVSKKLTEIGTDINQVYKGGDPKVINKLFSSKVKKELTPVEIREISKVSDKTPQKILNSTPEGFKEIIKKYNNHAVDILVNAPAEVLAKFDSDIADFQGLQLREALTKELSSGNRGSKVETKIEVDSEVKKESLDDFSGEGSLTVPKFEAPKTEPILDSKLNNIYGEGTKGTADTLRSVKDNLAGKNEIINRGIENGSKVEVVKAETPSVKSDGIDYGSVKLSPLPLSKGEVSMMKAMKDLVFSPITEIFQNASKRISTLGPKVKEAFVDIYRDARSSAVKDSRIEKDFARKFFHELRLTNKETLNVGRKMMMEQNSGPATLKRMKQLDKVPEKLSPKEQQLYDFLTDRYKTMVGMHNDARVLSGLDPMGTVDTYMPIVRKFTMKEKLGLTNKGEILNEEMFFNEMLSKDPATFSKTREFTDRAAELNVAETYLKYVDEFYKSTYELPVLGKMKKMINPVETVDGEKIWIKDQAPKTYEYLTDYIKYLEGVPQYKNSLFNNENSLFNNAMTKLSKNLGRSIIGANIRSVASQAAASWGMLTEMPKQALKTADKLLDPAAWTDAFQKSRMLADRVVDASYMDTTGKPVTSIRNLIKHPINAMTQLAFSPMRVIDIAFATWSWHAAYDFAKTKGVAEREAVRYADQKTIDWNASASKEDLSPIQRTPFGKAVTLFQTHPINQINWIGRDLIGLRFKEVPFEGTKIRPEGVKRKLDISESFLKDPKKAIKLINLLAVGTGLAYVYEKGLGMYSPIPSPGLAFFDVDEKGNPIPMGKAFTKATSELMSLFPVGSTAEWGGSGAFGAQFSEMWNFAEAIAGAMNDKKRGGGKDLAKHAAVILGVPGAKSFMREYRKFEKKQKELEKISDPKKAYRESLKELRKVMSEIKKSYKVTYD